MGMLMLLISLLGVIASAVEHNWSAIMWALVAVINSVQKIGDE